jgi:hypothetical protein
VRDVLKRQAPCLLRRKDGTCKNRIITMRTDGSRSNGSGNRDSDITMMACNNSQERDEDDWRELFKTADSRFKLQTGGGKKMGRC